MIPKLLVSVSGGKSSMYMACRLKTEYASQYDMRFVFANTGEENEATLQFVDQCDRAWNLGVVWIEATPYFTERRSTGHKIVNFETASRHGEPFEAIIKKYGIPNKAFPHCTRELKLNPIKSYTNSIGWTRNTFISAVGIRADEPKRLRSDPQIVYPIAHWFPITKPEINDWWEQQPFNLQLEDYQGNCKWCWKKSTSKLVRIAQETPEVFEFPGRMEANYAHLYNATPEYRRAFFRGNMNTKSLMALTAASRTQHHPNDPDEDSGCSESCEAFMTQAAFDYSEAA